MNRIPLYATASILQDYDNDGDFDIVYGCGRLNDFRILFNNVSGVFDNSKTLFLNNGQYTSSNGGLIIADVYIDGILDILTFSGVGFGGMYFLNGADNYNFTIIDIDGIDLGGDIVVADIDENVFGIMPRET